MKHKFALILILIGVFLLGCTSVIRNQGLDESQGEATEAGKAIAEYLRCLDLDCHEKLSAIVDLNGEAVVPLIDLLAKGKSKDVPDTPKPLPIGRIISALGALEDERAVSPITKYLSDSNPVVRATAASALGQIGDKNSLQSLLPLLQDNDYFVRESAALALGKLQQDEALQPLRDALLNETNQAVRTAVEEAIDTIQLK